MLRPLPLWLLCLPLCLPLGAACNGAHTKAKDPAHGGAHAHHHGKDSNVGKGHGRHAHGPVMGKRFVDAKKWAKRFDAPTRDAWQKPAAVIAALGLSPKQSVADIGAGTGYFSVRFAKALPTGKVYAIDIESTLVEHMKQRVKSAGLEKVVHPVLGAGNDPKIPTPVDLVFFCNTYHHIPNRPAYFRRVAAKLQPAGRIAIVDFKAGPLPVGPPEDHRTPPPMVERELKQAGLRRVSLDTTTLPHQFIAIYMRSSGKSS
jgi:ubiquinone/menaquinone biosynthesis C-methylase UbiE